MKRSGRRKRQGFTLIEMVVATVILFIAFASIFGALSQVSRTQAHAESVQTAAILARQRLSEIEMQPDAISGGDQQGEFGDDFPGYHWKQSVETTDYTSLFKVTITVQWGSGPTANETEYTTYLRSDQNMTDQQILQQQQQNTTQTSGGATGG